MPQAPGLRLWGMMFMADRYDEGFRSQVAFVTHTREYRSSEVLPALARHGFTTTERPHDRETERLISQFDPDLVVLAVDPRHDEDVALVRQVARASGAAEGGEVAGRHDLSAHKGCG